jgi:peptide chain release factor 3
VSCSAPTPHDFHEEIELVRGASHAFDLAAYLRGEQTPVFFGSAISNFGVRELLNGVRRVGAAARCRARPAERRSRPPSRR